MKISIGGDHAGFPLKATVIAVCKDLGHEVTDHGCYDETPVDFPDITRQVCADVLNGKAERAILVCGTGVGASIAANKIPGIRASRRGTWQSRPNPVRPPGPEAMSRSTAQHRAPGRRLG